MAYLTREQINELKQIFPDDYQLLNAAIQLFLIEQKFFGKRKVTVQDLLDVRNGKLLS